MGPYEEQAERLESRSFDASLKEAADRLLVFDSIAVEDAEHDLARVRSVAAGWRGSWADWLPFRRAVETEQALARQRAQRRARGKAA